MRFRDAVLEYQKTLDDAGTLTKDLDLVDPVSALYLEFQATNYTTHNEDNFISDVITKIEIVDGSDVLYSLNQSELEALHFYKLGKTPPLFPSEWPSTGKQRHGCYLLFGRYLGDPDFAVDFTKFRNPQLKITSNLAAISAVGAAGGFTTATLLGTIVAKVMEGATAPGKYLMAKELLSFTSTSSNSAEERKELPLDYPYRMLMTRHWVEGSDINEVTDKLKLTADADKFIAFDRRVQQLDAEAFAQFGACRLKHDIERATGATVRALCNKELHWMPNNWVTNLPRIFSVYNEWSSQFYVQMFDVAGAGDATRRHLSGVETGHALHATLPIPMGLMDKPETWFDPTPYKKLELVFTSAASGVAGACAIVAEQVRPN